MPIYDNAAYGPRCNGIKKRKILDEIAETSLKSRSWDEVKDRLKDNALAYQVVNNKDYVLQDVSQWSQK